MALEEETEIMRAIGLGQHYNWHNGSGGCRHTRIAAANKLPAELRARGMTANPDLMELVSAVAHRGEDSDYVLTKTWQVASDVIQAHLHRKAGMSPESFRDLVASLYTHYRPRTRPMVMNDGRYAL